MCGVWSILCSAPQQSPNSSDVLAAVQSLQWHEDTCVLCRCADALVTMCHDESAEVMIASHNQKSIERAVSLMHELGVEPQKSGIYFGQLLGMADHLTFILGRNGYRVSMLC